MNARKIHLTQKEVLDLAELVYKKQAVDCWIEVSNSSGVGQSVNAILVNRSGTEYHFDITDYESW